MFFSLILFFFIIISFSEVCGPVGVADRNKIPDAKMTASTLYNSYYQPYYGRLHEKRPGRRWCPKTESDLTDYLQVDLGALRSVCAVVTEGVESHGEWTTSYKLQFSLDGATWNAYKENFTEKVIS